MRKKLLCLVLVMLLLVPSLAWAADIWIGSIESPRAILAGSKEHPVVQLSWYVSIKDSNDNKDFIKPTSVSIIRYQGNYEKKVLVEGLGIPTTAKRGDKIKLTWNDSSVEMGKRYRYEIYCAPHSKSVEMSVNEKNIVTPDSGNTQKDIRIKYKETADWPERMVSSIIVAIPKYIIKVIGLRDPVELAFGVEIESPSLAMIGENRLKPQQGLDYLGVFTQNEFDYAINPIYDMLEKFLPINLLIIVVVIGVIIWRCSLDPFARLTAKDYLIGVFFALLLLKFAPPILGFLGDLNSLIIKQFYAAGVSVNPKLYSNGFLDGIYNPDTGLLGDAIIAALAVITVGVINFQYVMRKISIAVLLAVMPITFIISIFPSRRDALTTWFRELTASIFMQAAHAGAITFMFLLIHSNNVSSTSTSAGLIGDAFFLKLALCFGLPAVASLIRRVIGADSYGGGLFGDMAAGLGMGGLLAAGKILTSGRNAAKGKLDKLSDAAEAVGEKGGSGGVVGPALGGVAKNMAKRTAQFSAGAIGAMGGGVLTGALAGNPGAGMGLGAMVGGWAVGKTAELGGGIMDSMNKYRNFSPESSGISQDEMRYNPDMARQAGIQMLGNNIAGKALGDFMAYQAKSRAKGTPFQADVDAVKQNNMTAAQRLAQLEQAIPAQQMARDKAKADMTYYGKLYGKDSNYLKDLDKKIDLYEGARVEPGIKAETLMERAFPHSSYNLENWGSYDWQNDPWLEETDMARCQEIQEYYDAYQYLNDKYNDLKSEKITGITNMDVSKNNYEIQEARLAQIQSQKLSLEQQLSQDAMRAQFHSLVQSHRTNGTLNRKWRN